MATSQTGGGASAADVQNQAALNKELTETEELALSIKNTFRGITAELTEMINDKFKETKGSVKEIAYGIKKDIVGSLKEQSKEASRILALQNKQLNGSIKVADVDERISKAKEKQRNIAFALEEAVREGVITQARANKLLDIANVKYAQQIEALGEMRKKAEEFEKKLGITYKIFEGINKIPILNALVKVDKVQEKMREAATEGKSAWGVFGTGIKSTFSQIGKSLSDPLTIATAIGGIFTFMVKSAFEVDAHITHFAKSLGISKEFSHLLQKNFMEAGKNAESYNKNLNGALFTIKSQIEATDQLNESLGTAGLFSEKQLADQVTLTKQMGLSGEEAAKIQQLSMLQGKDAEKITNEVGDQVVAFRKETGIALNLKKVMSDVSKVSGQLSANLGNDPKRIAAAVMQAQKLGLTIEQTKKMSDSLLNFESSIQDELEAELLTGKKLNLEKARELALSGKTTEAAAELMSQVGGINEFQKMNVIQQQSIAKTVGLTADEMADSLKQQELLKGTAFATKAAFEEQAKLAEKNGTLAEFEASVRGAANGEELAKQAEQIGAQEKFQAAVEKVKETFAEIASGPMLNMIESFAKFISDADNLNMIIGTIKGLFVFITTVSIAKMISGFQQSLALQTLAATMAKKEAVADAAGAAAEGAKSTAKIPIVGGLLAIGTALSIFAGLSSMFNQADSVKDAAISPSGGLMISGPKGSFITDPADKIVAAPGASKMLGGGGGGEGISKADLDRIANRPVNVSVQANTDSIMRLQTAQSQYGAPNSFA